MWKPLLWLALLLAFLAPGAGAQPTAQQQEQAARVVNDAVTTWENEVRARDPDYPKKVAIVMRVSQALIAQNGQPTTADTAVTLAKQAYAETNEFFAQARMAASPLSGTAGTVVPPDILAQSKSYVPTPGASANLFDDLPFVTGPRAWAALTRAWLAGLAALAGQVIGTSLSPELWIAVALIVSKVRSWRAFCLAAVLATLAIVVVRALWLEVLGIPPLSGNALLQMAGATLVAIIVWSALGLGLLGLLRRFAIIPARVPANGHSRLLARTGISRNWRMIVAVFLTAFGAAIIADRLETLFDDAQHPVALPVFVSVVCLLSARIMWTAGRAPHRD
jgi:hypothetical protein